MPLAADRITEKKWPGEMSYLVKSATTIFAGSMVAIDGDGVALPAADAANLKVVGVAKKTVINPASGSLRVNVEAPVVAKFKAASITQAMVGSQMHVVDDETFDDAVGTNKVIAGVLMECISATEGWIYIDPTQHLLKDHSHD